MSDIETPHWEHGHRVHGLWRGNERLGFVSLGPPGLWTGTYLWGLQNNLSAPSLEARSLRSAKRAVEKALGLGPCPGPKRNRRANQESSLSESD